MLETAISKVTEDALVGSLHTTACTYLSLATMPTGAFAWPLLAATPGWMISPVAYRPLEHALLRAWLQAALWTAAGYAQVAHQPAEVVAPLYLIPAAYSA